MLCRESQAARCRRAMPAEADGHSMPLRRCRRGACCGRAAAVSTGAAATAFSLQEWRAAEDSMVLWSMNSSRGARPRAGCRDSRHWKGRVPRFSTPWQSRRGWLRPQSCVQWLRHRRDYGRPQGCTAPAPRHIRRCPRRVRPAVRVCCRECRPMRRQRQQLPLLQTAGASVFERAAAEKFA